MGDKNYVIHFFYLVLAVYMLFNGIIILKNGGFSSPWQSKKYIEGKVAYFWGGVLTLLGLVSAWVLFRGILHFFI